MATHALTSQDFEDVVAKNDLVFVDFWATWCGPCRMFGPVYEKASEKYTDAYFAKVDVDQNQDLASAANIQSIPTLMVIKKGKVIFQQPGALRSADLEKVIEAAQAFNPDEAQEA